MTQQVPAHSRRPSFLQAFLQSEALGGYVLMAAALAALIIANSPAAPIYFDVLGTKLGFHTGPVPVSYTHLTLPTKA